VTQRYPRLSVGGCAITTVFALNRSRQVADVWLEGAGVQQVRLAKVCGVPGSSLTRDQIRSQLEARAGLCFGEWPADAKPAVTAADDVAIYETGYTEGN
jgi:hypothetical protein